MRPEREELIPTRATLIARLKNWQDHTSWQLFFDTYWKLIYGVARKSGLTPVEAQDAVQETLFAVAKQMPGFKYNPAGSFKAWLLNLTRWKITDQLRKRGPLASRPPDSGHTDAGSVEEMPDPAVRPLEELWEADWQANLLEAALGNVQRRVDPLKFQLFDYYVHHGWAADKVAATFGVPIDQVYLTKHRVTELLKAEVERLEKETT